MANKSQKDFTSKQKEAWDLVRKSIDNGIPCYGWELEIPEFYVVYGYDDIGYYYSGPTCDSGKGPKPWQELGNTGIGLVEMYRIRKGQAADDTRTVEEALQFALDHAESPAKWIYPKYHAGLSGYDTWIREVENDTADGRGTAYNAAVWGECRSFAAPFLKEAGKRLNEKAVPLLEEAARRYSEVHKHLERVANLFPFPPGNEITEKERCGIAVAHLKDARKEEEAGLQILKQIVASI